MSTLSPEHAVYWQPSLAQSGRRVTAADDISQSIRVILGTPKGSDPHRPEFGSNLSLYLDMPAEQAVPHVVRESVDAIRRWEPRCVLQRVTPVVEGEHVMLRIRWQAIGTDEPLEVVWR